MKSGRYVCNACNGINFVWIPKLRGWFCRACVSSTNTRYNRSEGRTTICDSKDRGLNMALVLSVVFIAGLMALAVLATLIEHGVL